MLQRAGGDAEPLPASPLVLCTLAQHRDAQRGFHCRVVVKNVVRMCNAPTPRPELLNLSHGECFQSVGNSYNCFWSVLCCPLLHFLILMWYVCRVIRLSYLMYKVGVGGRVREDTLI